MYKYGIKYAATWKKNESKLAIKQPIFLKKQKKKQFEKNVEHLYVYMMKYFV